MQMINDRNLQFKPPPLEKFLKKYGEGRRRRNIEPLYQAMMAEAQQHAQPQFLAETFLLESVETLHPWLPPSTQSVILAVCTLGQPLHDRLSALGKMDTLAEYVLNEVAIEWLRNVVAELHQSLRQTYWKQELKVGPTYRPGVGRWPLETQRVIFSQLHPESIGVTLDENLFMIPILSNSLIMPVMKQQ